MKKFNAFKVYLRGFSLLLSLVLVLSVIAYLRGGSARNFIDHQMSEFLGVQPPPHQPTQNFRLCKTRIESLEWANGARIYEDVSQAKPRWMSQDQGGKARELNSLEIEKWFGINCQVRVRVEKAVNIGCITPYLKIKFVGDEIDELQKARDSHFLTGTDYFKSTELDQSLEELYKLGDFDSPPPKDLKCL